VISRSLKPGRGFQVGFHCPEPAGEMTEGSTPAKVGFESIAQVSSQRYDGQRQLDSMNTPALNHG